jgi:hypothetical protein
MDFEHDHQASQAEDVDTAAKKAMPAKVPARVARQTERGA